MLENIYLFNHIQRRIRCGRGGVAPSDAGIQEEGGETCQEEGEGIEEGGGPVQGRSHITLPPHHHQLVRVHTNVVVALQGLDIQDSFHVVF